MIPPSEDCYGNFIRESKSTVFDCTNMLFLPAMFQFRRDFFELDLLAVPSPKKIPWDRKTAGRNDMFVQ